MDIFLIKATQLIMALAILVVIHEFGHFFFSRLFGVKVEKFYIFFNPWTSLFKWKPKKHTGSLSRISFKNDEAREDYEELQALYEAESKYESAKGKLDKASPNGVIDKMLHTADPAAAEEARKEMAEAEKEIDRLLKLRNQRDAADYEKQKKEGRWKRFWGHTEYGIGWLPLGGYCKIGGMIDESMDTAQMKNEPQPWEFRSKPAWQRLLIMIAGVLFNFLLAIVIYAGLVYATGERYVAFEDAKMGMDFSPAAKTVGFQDGDIPIMADGEKLENPGEARMAIAQASKVTVLRNGSDTVTISIPEDFIFKLDKEVKEGKADFNMMTYRFPAKVTLVSPGEGASKAGLKENDVILSVDSVNTPTLLSFLKTMDGVKGDEVKLTVERSSGASTDTIILPVSLNSDAKMGIGLETNPGAFFKVHEKKYSLLASVPRGIEMGTDKLVSYAKSMKLVFTKEGAKSVGGFGALGSIFPEKWDWIAFWNIAAFLSVALAFMNILPIPALDGGHVLFLLCEVITGRKPSQKFMERAQMIGMILLLLLLLYANGMDIVRLFVKP